MDELMWHSIYNSAIPHLTALHLDLCMYVGHSFWSSAFLLSKNRFQVGSMYSAPASVCQ